MGDQHEACRGAQVHREVVMAAGSVVLCGNERRGDTAVRCEITHRDRAVCGELERLGPAPKRPARPGKPVTASVGTAAA